MQSTDQKSLGNESFKNLDLVLKMISTIYNWRLRQFCLLNGGSEFFFFILPHHPNETATVEVSFPGCGGN